MKYIVGVDEVGRGALAGPMMVAAVAIPIKFKTKNLKLKMPLRDSKKLTELQREAWFQYIKKHPKICYAVAKVSPKVIDRINIAQAANSAATRAFLKLTKNFRRRQGFGGPVKLKTKNYSVFLDGGLYLTKSIRINPLYQHLSASTIIKGDEKYNCIKLASIVAKITRDRLMKKLHKKYPQYDFIHNVGYGTKRHIRAIRKFGLSSIHRKSFTRQLTTNN